MMVGVVGDPEPSLTWRPRTDDRDENRQPSGRTRRRQRLQPPTTDGRSDQATYPAVVARDCTVAVSMAVLAVRRTMSPPHGARTDVVAVVV